MAGLEGYNGKVEGIRSSEFPNLKGNVYLDHAGTTLYSRSQIDAVHADLMSNLYGNPHSHSLSSNLTTDAVDQVRYRVLRFLNASPEEYTVIFTSGCTGSLQLLAECFDFGRVANQSKEKSSETVNLKEDSRQPGGDNKSLLSDLDSKYHQYPQNGPPGRRGCFCYLLDNHTSVQGMREIAASKGAEIICFEEADLMGVSVPEGTHQAENGEILESNGRPAEFTAGGLGLWAIPAQSNFSGRKYSLGWLRKAKNGQFRMQKSFPGPWFTLLDSAAFTSTSPLDLSQHKPDFVTLSFYKIFGYPTGLGALIVHKDALCCLEKTYYGGGTIAVSTAKSRFHVNSPKIPERFEDGTVSFLDIIALRHGFDALDRIGGGMAAISRHTFTLARYFHHRLSELSHGNGRPLAVIYCNNGFSDAASQGAIVNFNLLRANGDFAGFAEVDKLAQLHSIHLRTGCFCNIGACQIHLNMTEAQIRKNYSAGHVCGDNKDLVDGLPTGSVRISFGYMSTLEDAQKCLQFIADCFLEEVNVKPVFSRLDCKISSSQLTNQSTAETISSVNHEVSSPIKSSEKTSLVIGQSVSNPTPPVTDPEKTGVFLTNIYLYPVKSCGAFAVEEWELCSTGFLYDRNWMIVNEGGVSLGQKREPKLCLLCPEIRLDRRKLILKYPGMNPLELPLDATDSTSVKAGVCSSKVCGDRINGTDCGDEASDWLREALERPGCRLIQQTSTQERRSKLKDAGEGAGSVAAPMALTNQSQFLLISRASIRRLQEKLHENQAKFQDEEVPDTENLIDRFRGNLVVEGGEEFAEEEWSSVRVGAVSLVSQGRCSRCQMISMDQRTGQKSNEPLRTLGSWRGGKIPFGIYLRWVAETSERRVIRVGDSLTAH